MQKNPMVILDGAHNKAKLESTLENLKRFKYEKLHLVVGLSSKKDAEDILKSLIEQADTIYITRFQIHERKCASPKELFEIASKFKKANARLYVFLDPHQALDEAIKNSDKNDCILATGSFYMVGELRERWISEECILENHSAF